MTDVGPETHFTGPFVQFLGYEPGSKAWRGSVLLVTRALPAPPTLELSYVRPIAPVNDATSSWMAKCMTC